MNPLYYLRYLIKNEDSHGIEYPEAFVLSTSGQRLKDAPSSRMVLCKKVTEDSIYFYTNYESNKALEIQRIPNVSALFYFKEEGIQIRLKGEVIKMGDAQSDEYWNTRPYLSKVGGAVSKQSRKLSFKFLLYLKVLLYILKHGTEVPRPSNWGGYILVPKEVEVFHMGSFRLNSRTLYKLKNKHWEKENLYP